MTLYATGMRRAELCQLRTEDIDKERMVIHIRHGKGDKPRDVPLTPKLLEQLRTHYRALKVKTGWVFPSVQELRRDEPMTCKTVWHACEFAAKRAGITKHIHPHMLRHSFATHLFDHGAELPVVQRLLGHEDPRDTMIYLDVSTRTMRAAPNPLDTLTSATEPGSEPAAS
jgi:integrase/recombinase XerD